MNEYTPWSGLLCGGLHNVPNVLYSSGPTLIFEFHTGPAITTAVTNGTNTGFSGTFRFIDRRKYFSTNLYIESNHKLLKVKTALESKFGFYVKTKFL